METLPSRPIVGAVDDLGIVLARLDVVWDEGWWPAQPDREAPRSDSGADVVPGPRWDFGLGNHRARQAWHRIDAHLEAADGLSRLVLAYLDPVHSHPQSPILISDGQVVRPDQNEPEVEHGENAGRIRPNPSLQSTRTTALMLRRRVEGLRKLRDGTHPSDISTWIETALAGRAGHPHGSVCWHVEQARHAVVGIVAIVGNGRRPHVCGRCRKPGTVGDPRRKGWCAACYRAWFRGDRATTLSNRRRPAVMADNC